jgi:hypothetical protein
MMNDEMNQVLRGSTLCTNPADHDALRRVAIKPLRPRELPELTDEVTREAERVVDPMVARGSSEASANSVDLWARPCMSISAEGPSSEQVKAPDDRVVSACDETSTKHLSPDVTVQACPRSCFVGGLGHARSRPVALMSCSRRPAVRCSSRPAATEGRLRRARPAVHEGTFTMGITERIAVWVLKFRVYRGCASTEHLDSGTATPCAKWPTGQTQSLKWMCHRAFRRPTMTGGVG